MTSATPKRHMASEVMVIQRARKGSANPFKITIKYRSPHPSPAVPPTSTGNMGSPPLVPLSPTGNGGSPPSFFTKSPGMIALPSIVISSKASGSEVQTVPVAPSANGDQSVQPSRPNGNGKVWKCDKCEIKFQAKSTYYYHMNKHKILDGTGKIRCNKCEEQFVSTRDLKRHLKIHEAGITSFWCKECNRRFASQGYFKRHQRSHSDLKKGCFKCRICSKVFSSRRTLLRHKFTIHPKRHLESFVAQICPMCPCGFLTRNSFIQHMSKHIKQENAGVAMEQAESEDETEYNEMPILDLQLGSTVEMIDPIGDEFESEESPNLDINDIFQLTEMPTCESFPAFSETSGLVPTSPLSQLETLTEDTNVEYEMELDRIAEIENETYIPCEAVATETNANLNTVTVAKKIETKIDNRDPLDVHSTALIKQFSTSLMTQLVSIFNNDVPDYPF